MNIDPQWMWIGGAAVVVMLIAAATLAKRSRREHETRLEQFAVIASAQQAQQAPVAEVSEPEPFVAAVEPPPAMVAEPEPFIATVRSEIEAALLDDDDLGTIVARPARVAVVAAAPKRDVEKAIPTENELDAAFDRITLDGTTRLPDGTAASPRR